MCDATAGGGSVARSLSFRKACRLVAIAVGALPDIVGLDLMMYHMVV